MSLFEDFLKREHCTMVSTSNAENALSVVSHQPINLVITDIRMKWQSVSPC
jgi:DNA-binding NtrC family response regulator